MQDILPDGLVGLIGKTLHRDRSALTERNRGQSMTELADTQLVTSLTLRKHDLADADSADLATLADQLIEIAKELRQSSVKASHVRDAGSHQTDQMLSPRPPDSSLVTAPLEQTRAANAEAARDIYAARRRRTVIFGNPELFGEPAWDILLDLYIAYAEGKQVSVSSACIGSAAPPTTGLRWLGVLAEQGLILREHDPEDQRRVLVRLTERGLCAMDEYFSKTGMLG